MNLWLDPEIQQVLVLGDKWGKPLFEICPHKFPQGYLTDVERILWMHYYVKKAEVLK